jgi:hypothetical protein
VRCAHTSLTPVARWFFRSRTPERLRESGSPAGTPSAGRVRAVRGRLIVRGGAPALRAEGHDFERLTGTNSLDMSARDRPS